MSSQPMSASDLGSVRSAAASPSQARQISAVVIANMLEAFDFTIYTYFAVMIGNTFFPTYAPSSQLLFSVGVFGVGFFTRPIGALVIGAYADRAGRRAAMVLTFKLMFIGTAILALTPSYATIGVAAPLLVLLARMIQGFSMGGEMGPSTTYLLEMAGGKRRGIYTSLQLVTTGAAALLAAGLGYLLSVSLTDDQLQSWGWRLPLLVGLLIFPAGIYLRNSLPETLLSNEALPDAASIFAKIKSNHLADLLITAGIVVGPSVTIYIAGHYMTTYGIKVLHMPTSTAMMASLIGGAVATFGALAAGMIFDRKPAVWLMAMPQFLLTLAVYPCFLWILQDGGANVFFICISILALLRVAGAPLQFVFIPESFPPIVRATCVSVCYALATTLFGGTAQFVVTWLLNVTGDPMSPAWYMVFANGLSSICFLALVVRRRTRPQIQRHAPAAQ